MDMIIQCHICGIEIARHACRKCGANVCGNCFDKERGVCERCAFRQG